MINTGQPILVNSGGNARSRALSRQLRWLQILHRDAMQGLKMHLESGNSFAPEWAKAAT